MEVKIEEPKSYIREITVSLPYKILEEERQRIAENYRENTLIPGFRKGKAPIPIILSRFKKEIEKEAQDNVIKNAFIRALKDNSLSPISVADIEDIVIPEAKKDITFRARFQVIPDFEVKLNGIKTIYKPVEVKKEDIKKVIADLQGKYTTLRPALRPSKAGDSIEFDYKIFDDNDNIIDTVQNMVIECKDETDRNLLYSLLSNVKPGDTVRGKISYPKEFPVIELHGKDVTIMLEINEVKEKVIPEIDDNFAKTLGLDTLKALEESIYNQLSKENEEEALSAGEDELLDKLLKKNNFEVPGALTDYYFRKQKEEMKYQETDELEEKELLKVAEKKARLNIILDKIAEKEKVTVPEDDIEKFIEEEASKKSFSKEALKKYLIQTGRIEDIITMFRREETYKFLLKNYLIKE